MGEGFGPTARVPLFDDSGTRRAGSGLWSYMERRLPRLPSGLVSSAVITGLVVTLPAAAAAAWRRRPARAGSGSRLR